MCSHRSRCSLSPRILSGRVLWALGAHSGLVFISMYAYMRVSVSVNNNNKMHTHYSTLERQSAHRRSRRISIKKKAREWVGWKYDSVKESEGWSMRAFAASAALMSGPGQTEISGSEDKRPFVK